MMKRSWTCLSHQKVEGLSKVEKPQRPEKSTKTIGLEEPSFLTSDTRLAFTKMGSSHTNSQWRTTSHCWKRIGGATWKLQANHNNLRQFRDTKSSSFRQVCRAQELSRYHVRIDYRQSKANGAVDALLRYSLEEPGRSSSRGHSSLSPAVTNGPSAPSFCLQDARHPYAQLWRCAPEEDVLVQDQLDDSEEVEGIIKAGPTFLRSSELS